MRRHRTLLTLLPLLLAGCLLNSEPSGIDDADLRVLFIGNSLTYTNDMPAMVAQLAAARGRSFAYGTAAQPNFSLEDHWASGIAGVIQEQRADVVVMQQGPSSLPASQAHLVFWAGQFAPLIRQAGGEPALLMVWPDASRLFAFDDVHLAYRNAAASVDGIWLPAGEAWRAGWSIDPTLPAYGGDGFHPSAVGSLAAALTVYAVLFEARAELESCPFPLLGGVTAAELQVLCAAVLDALDRPPPVQEPDPKGAFR